MKKMLSKELFTKNGGGEFLIELQLGDVFISFHTKTENCAGVTFKKNELNAELFEKLLSSVSTYFGSDFKNIEIKIIGQHAVVDKVETMLVKNGLKNNKKIIKNTRAEVAFLPVLNKVRVAIDTLKAVPPKKIKVLVVDDSKTIRIILNKIFSSDPMFEVCAMAEKPSEVDALINKHKPDLITLDIHMPEMDGVSLLKIIAPKYKIPTIMISSISIAEGPLVLEALEHGAIDYIQKPEMSELEKVTPMIIEKAKTAAMANHKKSYSRDRVVVKTKERCQLDSLVVIGSSTGGTEALREILTGLPDQVPPILIVQHIPAVFSAAFAKRMNDLCKFEVKEAENGDEVKANRVLIAPGGKQMKMVHKSGKTSVEITDDEPVNRFKPSVDYLFFTVAKSLFTHTVAVILTGMGKDGAKGMLELKRLGVQTIAQDEATSIVFGMPKEAINLGAADYIEPLPEIAEKIAILTHKHNQNKVGIA